MIGIGSGVSPFIGMLEHKQLAQKGSSDYIFNEMSLIFGIRNKNTDFIEQKFFSSKFAYSQTKQGARLNNGIRSIRF